MQHGGPNDVVQCTAEEQTMHTGTGPPRLTGWFVGLMWTLIYPLWGLARWRVRLYSTASRMLIGLMVWGFLYTIITGPAGPMTGAICNGISLLFVILASLLAARRDRIALFLMVPSIIWVVFANYLGLAALHAAPML